MRLDHGQIGVELGGEEITLKPTLEAMQKINQRFGNLREAIQQVQALDFESVVFILSAGSGRRDIKHAAFEAGLINLTEPVASYLIALMDPSGREGSGSGKA